MAGSKYRADGVVAAPDADGAVAPAAAADDGVVAPAAAADDGVVAPAADAADVFWVGFLQTVQS